MAQECTNEDEQHLTDKHTHTHTHTQQIFWVMMTETLET